MQKFRLRRICGKLEEAQAVEGSGLCGLRCQAQP